MKLTGERPIEGSTPDSLIALHEAGYREVAARLGPGTVLDIGCGVGDATMRLSAPDRFVIGIDYDAPTAIGAQAKYGAPGHAGFGAMDGSRLGLRDHSIDWVCSSHVVEHFTQPERHVAELARLVAPDGTVFVLTPNHPADFENPFHVYDFEPPQLDSLLRLFFDDVTVLGLEGDDAFAADFGRRRASGERLLRLDRFELRKHLPQRTYVWAYERVLPMVYRVLGSKTTGIGSGLDDSHLYMNDSVVTTTPVLFAIARRPRARVA
ncbi:MAG TPA: class I SAM-dependent methyltransferase [Acidimicrobiia bacterium]|jgi:SAM-dependent methyltransferase